MEYPKTQWFVIMFPMSFHVLGLLHFQTPFSGLAIWSPIFHFRVAESKETGPFSGTWYTRKKSSMCVIVTRGEGQDSPKIARPRLPCCWGYSLGLFDVLCSTSPKPLATYLCVFFTDLALHRHSQALLWTQILLTLCPWTWTRSFGKNPSRGTLTWRSSAPILSLRWNQCLLWVLPLFFLRIHLFAEVTWHLVRSLPVPTLKPPRMLWQLRWSHLDSWGKGSLRCSGFKTQHATSHLWMKPYALSF